MIRNLWIEAQNFLFIQEISVFFTELKTVCSDRLPAKIHLNRPRLFPSSSLPIHPAHPHGLPGTDSYPSHGPGLAPKSSHGTNPARPHGIPRTDSYSLHGPGLAPKSSHGTTSAPAKQQVLKNEDGRLMRYTKEASLDAS